MLRVLVADDEYSMRAIARMFFEECGLTVEVDEAENGEDALRLLGERRYDCVLTDHRMGAVSGLEVLKEAKHRQPDALRFMMTGYRDEVLAAAAREEVEVHGFLEKPIGLAAIHQALDVHVLKPYLENMAQART